MSAHHDGHPRLFAALRPAGFLATFRLGFAALARAGIGAGGGLGGAVTMRSDGAKLTA